MNSSRRCSQNLLVPVHRIARIVVTRVIEVVAIEAEAAVVTGVVADEEGKASSEASENPLSQA